MRRSLLVLSLYVLVVSCATTPSFYGERRLAPSDISKMVVLIDARSDNAVLGGNEFLQKSIIEGICDALREKGVNATSAIGLDLEKETYSHVLVLQSLGTTTTQGYLHPATLTTPVYQSGIDTQETAYVSSTTQTVPRSGVTYIVNEVRVKAVIFLKTTEGARQDSSLTESARFEKLCEAQAHGDGMSFAERAWNMTRTAQLLGHEKSLASVYRDMLFSAASSLFAK